MYKFNYQYLDPCDTPIIACIVPTDWLAPDLPALWGVVTYRD